jgi:predicted ABC-type ATPase
MSEKKLFIIAGCNGAGKTTASYTILPELLECREFVNADEIAKGLSPFQPDKVALQAGRLMLERINDLLHRGENFSFETTLSTKSYKNLVSVAIEHGYTVTLIFFWLESVDLAKERVRIRVSEGGHNIPPEVIERRYHKGLRNLFEIYLSLVHGVFIFDNTQAKSE